MALNLKNIPRNKGPGQASIPAGVYPGRIVQLIDLGLQPQKPFAGKEKQPAFELILGYELVDEFMKDEDGNDIPDKPRWVSETLPVYGLEADKAKSTQRYLALDPNQNFEGDFTKLVNLPCNVAIVNNQVGDKTYDNVGSISPMRPRDAANCPELKNAPRVFDLDNPDIAMFNSFPKWIQDKVKGNLNFKGSKLEAALKVGKPTDKPVEKAPKDGDEADDQNPY